MGTDCALDVNHERLLSWRARHYPPSAGSVPRSKHDNVLPRTLNGAARCVRPISGERVTEGASLSSVEPGPFRREQPLDDSASDPDARCAFPRAPAARRARSTRGKRAASDARLTFTLLQSPAARMGAHPQLDRASD